MSIRVGINGYGRIGRNILRALYEAGRQDLSRMILYTGPSAPYILIIHNALH